MENRADSNNPQIARAILTDILAFMTILI